METNGRVLSLKRPAAVPVDVLEQTEKPPFVSSEVDHEGSLNCPKPADTPTTVSQTRPYLPTAQNAVGVCTIILSQNHFRRPTSSSKYLITLYLRVLLIFINEQVRPPQLSLCRLQTPLFPDVSISSPIPVSLSSLQSQAH